MRPSGHVASQGLVVFMQVTVYGTRGSYPVCQSTMMRYGGNTTCWLLEVGDDLIIIDGGTGIVELGRRIVKRYPDGRRIHICLTHPHWDHILGMPYFQPFFLPGFEITIHGADSPRKPLDTVLSAQYKPGSFTRRFEQLSATVSLEKVRPGEQLSVGSTVLKTMQLNHHGIDLGFRFEHDSSAFVFLTDLAPIKGNILGAGMLEASASELVCEQAYMNRLVNFTAGADLVVHDTNFTDETIEGRLHWGHSTPRHAMQLLSHHNDPSALVLSHHDPEHTDEMMDGIYMSARRLGQDMGMEVFVAKEGGTFQL